MSFLTYINIAVFSMSLCRFFLAVRIGLGWISAAHSGAAQ